jgi:hypothetical protein
MEGTLSYKKSFGDWLNLDVVTGVGQYLEDYSGFSVETSNLQDAINTDNLASATGPKIIGSYRGVNKLRSFFVRSNFDFLIDISFLLLSAEMEQINFSLIINTRISRQFPPVGKLTMKDLWIT